MMGALVNRGGDDGGRELVAALIIALNVFLLYETFFG